MDGTNKIEQVQSVRLGLAPVSAEYTQFGISKDQDNKGLGVYKWNNVGGTIASVAATLQVDTPTKIYHAATKGYVDSKIASAGGVDFMASGAVPMTGDLNMDNHKIVAVSDPTEATDGANKHYVDSAVTSGIAGAQFLPLAGGTLTGALNLAAAPSEDLQAATKKYVDDATATIATLTSQLQTANSEISTLKSQVSTLNTFMNKFQPMLNTIYNG